MAYQTSQGLASLGRNGDSVLVHMNPTEVAGLQSLAMSQGGSLTINPHTGLPEAFNLGGFFKSLLPVFAGAMTGGAGMPLWAGIAAGAATGAVTSKDKLMGAITGGLGGYGGYGLGSGLAAAGAAPGVAPVAPAGGYVPGTVEGANTALNVAGTYNPALSPATTNAVNAMNASGFAGSAGTGASGVDKSFLGGMDRLGSGAQQMGSGIKNIATGQEGAFDAFKRSFVEPGAKPISDLAAYGKIAMPIGGAALGGLEPSDIYGEPINMDEAKRKQRYDPNATLNLSGDTGLRLYATGGTIQSGGIRDLYGTPDNQPTISPGLSGFGLGRLNNLAGEQAMTQAQTLGYAMGGPVSFADGGDSNKDAMKVSGLFLSSSMQPNPGVNLAIPQSVMGATQPMQGMQESTTAQDQMLDQSNDSLISQVTANLRVDPNYQPKNPIEASIVKQIKGTDPMQQGQPSLQGLGSLTPSQPTAPSYAPSVAMGPTYYAGMNAPRGYADGGDVVAGEKGMNLDELPTLNLNTGVSSLGGSSGEGSNIDSYRMKSFMDDYYRLPLAARGGMGSYVSHEARNSKYLPGPFFSQALAEMGGIDPDVYNAKVMQLARGDAPFLNKKAKGGYLDGQGDGMSDSIPATIEGKQPARLADGEFVVPADVVSHIGNGSSKAGSKRLYAMLDKVRKARTGHTKQGKQIKPEKYMPA